MGHVHFEPVLSMSSSSNRGWLPRNKSIGLLRGHFGFESRKLGFNPWFVHQPAALGCRCSSLVRSLRKVGGSGRPSSGSPMPEVPPGRIVKPKRRCSTMQLGKLPSVELRTSGGRRRESVYMFSRIYKRIPVRWSHAHLTRELGGE